MIDRLILTIATITATMACGGSSPTAPTPINLSGQWTGQYTISSCTETGSAVNAGFCTSLGSRGGLTFTTSSTTSAVTGTLVIGGFTIPVTGSLNGSTLSLTGSSQIVQNFQLTTNTWQATVSGSSMTGNMAFTVIATTPPIGSVTVSASTALAR